MGQALSEIERKVIDILVQHEPTAGAYGAPIHAVNLAMGWSTAKTVKFVGDLIDRKVLHWEPVVRQGRQYDPKSIWKEGPPTERTHRSTLRPYLGKPPR